METKFATAVQYLTIIDTVATQAPHEAGQEDDASCITSAVTLRTYTIEDNLGDPVDVRVLPRNIVIEAGYVRPVM